jgi:hypothetical protein
VQLIGGALGAALAGVVVNEEPDDMVEARRMFALFTVAAVGGAFTAYRAARYHPNNRVPRVSQPRHLAHRRHQEGASGQLNNRVKYGGERFIAQIQLRTSAWHGTPSASSRPCPQNAHNLSADTDTSTDLR